MYYDQQNRRPAMPRSAPAQPGGGMTALRNLNGQQGRPRMARYSGPDARPANPVTTNAGGKNSLRDMLRGGPNANAFANANQNARFMRRPAPPPAKPYPSVPPDVGQPITQPAPLPEPIRNYPDEKIDDAFASIARPNPGYLTVSPAPTPSPDSGGMPQPIRGPFPQPMASPGPNPNANALANANPNARFVDPRLRAGTGTAGIDFDYRAAVAPRAPVSASGLEAIRRTMSAPTARDVRAGRNIQRGR
jgi:hypothetical protein